MEKSHKKKPELNIGFMRQNGSGEPCLISKDMSDSIADWENVSPIRRTEMTTERRKEIENNIASSFSPENERELRDTLQNIDNELMTTNPSIPKSPITVQKFSQEYCFEIVNGRLTSYNGMNETIVLVPHGVVTISESAFGRENSESIKTIILPETVVAIEDFAFSGCDNLNYINFPNSLRKIGQKIFGNTSKDHLKHIYIPDCVEECSSIVLFGSRLASIRLPLHLVNNTDAAKYCGAMVMIIALPKEDEVTSSQDKVMIEKLLQIQRTPSFFLESYASSHFTGDNRTISVNGCIIQSDFSGRDYIPDSEDEEYNYVITIPSKECVIPDIANVLDYKCGWHHTAPVLYIPANIDYIAPNAFKDSKTFVTPADNKQHLREILKEVEFDYQIVVI